ncbi:MAG: carbonic anhydrase [Gammaproteobacteria bacterium]|jgi:carbonic anhydrase
MRVLKTLLDQNKNWADKIKAADPDFFTHLAKQQSPEILWIGCSDSRVPANQIIDVPPGQVFVHRNIANLVVVDDINCLSVIQFAVEMLKVKHIIVCGHYGCGGVQAALNGECPGILTDWLKHIKAVHKNCQEQIDTLDNEKERVNRLCELNVIAQVKNLSQTSPVCDAWNRDHDLSIHGWIYKIEDGVIQDLKVSISGKE